MRLLSRIAIILAAAALLAPAADQALINLAPADAKMIAGIDIERAKNSAFGQQLMAQMREDEKGFQEFIEATGFDPRRDLREVVVAGDETKKNGMVAIRGTFDLAKIRALLQSKGVKPMAYGGVEIWSDFNGKGGDGAMALLDSSLAIAGNEAQVKAALDRRGSGSGLPAAVATKINDWSGRFDAWFISTGPLSPGAAKMGTLNGAANFQVDSILEAAAGVRFRSDLEVAAETVMRSPQDATALADIVRFLASMVRMNAGKNGVDDSALKVLDTLQVTTSGATTRVSLTVPEESLQKVFQRKGGKARPATRASR